MFKDKIKEALQQRHKNLGLSEEVFERVAASIETFINEESAIDGFVQHENTLNLLKSYQSVADKARAEAKAKNEPPKAPENGNQPNTNPSAETPKPAVNDSADLEVLLTRLLDEKLKPFTDRIDGFEAAQAQKSAIAALNERKSTWDYAKAYPDECEEAFEIAMELYEVGGKKWNADEIIAKFEEKFNKAVIKKGIDTSKPFKSDGGGNQKPDFKDEVELLRNAGVEMPE